MRGRGWLTALTAAILLAGLAACGGGGTPVFHPAGSLAAGGDPAPAARAVSAPGGFRFPPSVSVQFGSPLPASGLRRAILAGYQDYVLALWAAVLSHGRDGAYQNQMTGNALRFAQREIAYFGHRRTVRGTISYFGTTVRSPYSAYGAEVTSCVDASRFSAADARTGAVTGTVFPAKYARYLEDVAEERHPDGTWFVAQIASYPASTSKGAVCQ
jgi:hypothetical protein